jgi:hypothetical protein
VQQLSTLKLEIRALSYSTDRTFLHLDVISTIRERPNLKSIVTRLVTIESKFQTNTEVCRMTAGAAANFGNSASLVYGIVE